MNYSFVIEQEIYIIVINVVALCWECKCIISLLHCWCLLWCIRPMYKYKYL